MVIPHCPGIPSVKQLGIVKLLGAQVMYSIFDQSWAGQRFQIHYYLCIYLIYIYIWIYEYIYMSHRKNPGNTKYVLDGHWFMEIDGTC